MMELPEAVTIAAQLNQVAKGKKIQEVTPGNSPHKFAFFCGDPAGYDALLRGRRVEEALALGGFVQLSLDDGWMLLFGDGVRLTWFAADEELPKKYQLLVRFSGGEMLCARVQMYGGMWAAKQGEYDNPYYLVAQQKPSPLADAFDEAYFAGMLEEAKPSLSAKAFLGTEQRIPGLGNGVMQDIFFCAKVHPKRKLETLTQEQKQRLFTETKRLLGEVTEKGGRDTEKDLFDKNGAYQTILNAKSAGAPCPVCGAVIQKQAFLGGSIYFCPACQPL